MDIIKDNKIKITREPLYIHVTLEHTQMLPNICVPVLTIDSINIHPYVQASKLSIILSLSTQIKLANVNSLISHISNSASF